MKCPFCNKEIESDAAFCEHCGQIITTSDSNHSEADTYWNKENNKRKKLEEEYQKQEEQFELLQKYRTKKRRNIIISIVAVLIVLTSVTCFVLYGIPNIQYNKAKDLLNNENYNEALALFSGLGDYKDSEEHIVKCQTGIKSDIYEKAKDKFEQNDYNSALKEFLKVNTYLDSTQYVAQCELALLNDASQSDTVTFGIYEETPLEWIVIEKRNGSVLLLSKYYLLNKIANEYTNNEYNCWSDSSLRDWLNETFYNSSFSKEEKLLIMKNDIYTDEYDLDVGYETEINVKTTDKVYIPSTYEVDVYNIQPTTLISEKDTNITGWLRDRGHGIAFQRTLEPDGNIGSEWHFRQSYGIRPILRVELDINSDNGVHNSKGVIPSGSVQWGGHHYLVVDESLGWSDANMKAKEQNGYLVTITSEAEQKFVNSLLLNSSKNMYWIGGKQGTSTWYWITGESFTYTNWGEGEPNNQDGSEGFLQIYAKSINRKVLGDWNDASDSGAAYSDDFYSLKNTGYIVEWDN